MIKIVDQTTTWEEAIELGVDLLVQSDIATAQLAQEIIASTKKLGPYYVLLPKLALAHVMPGPYNKAIGLSLVVFRKPVAFSDQARHEVQLLFTLSALDADSHMAKLQTFATLFANKALIDQVIACSSEAALYELLKELF